MESQNNGNSSQAMAVYTDRVELMRVAFRRNCEFKIFGVKIFNFKTDYIEHSLDKEDEDDGLFVSFQERVVRNK